MRVTSIREELLLIGSSGIVWSGRIAPHTFFVKMVEDYDEASSPEETISAALGDVGHAGCVGSVHLDNDLFLLGQRRGG